MGRIFLHGFFSVKSELKKYPVVYLILFTILLLATLVRVYNVDRNLGFYFDQGRDALVIWDFWKNGNLFLIGPTTGIEGIFRGPWYYWLITPIYFLSQGDPVYPAVFLSLTTVLAIFFLFLVAKQMVNAWAGLIASTIGSFSYYIVVHSRWLSNPTPMLLISILIIWSMQEFTKGKKWSFPLLGFLAGMAMQFGSAAEIFYIPTVLVFVFWQRRKLSKKLILLSSALFFASFVPQIIFDFLNGGILSSAILNFLTGERSFRLDFWQVVGTRLNQYWFIFSSTVFLAPLGYVLTFVLGSGWIIVANYKKFLKKPMFRILILFLVIPMVGMFFFQGNYGNVFDYYYSGYFFPMILLFSLPLGYAMENWGGKLAVGIFLIIFFNHNYQPVRDFVIRGRTHFTYDHQKKAIEWIYKDAGVRQFNVDVYVPPVIPYAYDYLFKWYPGTSLKTETYGTGSTLVDEKVSLLYTVYELDPPAPERLKAWLNRQDGIGKVEKEYSYGGITVQRRTRK